MFGPAYVLDFECGCLGDVLKTAYTCTGYGVLEAQIVRGVQDILRFSRDAGEECGITSGRCAKLLDMPLRQGP